MKTTLKSRLVTGILVLIVVGLGVVIGGDVTVREGNLDVDGNLNVDGYATVDYDLTVKYDLNVYDNLDVDDDADIGGSLDVTWAVYSYWVDTGDVISSDDVEAGDVVEGDYVFGSIGIFGKVYCGGGYDPAYVLYDTQTREEIIDRIKKEVYPEKQNGAALFFNADTKRLETYIPSEGKFYDLQGNVTYTMPTIELPTTIYGAVYYLDRQTGMAESWQKPMEDRYRLKKGFTLDEITGQFINRDTGEIVQREQALELYVPSEGNFYDLQGNLVRSEPREGEIQYVTEYYFDRLTGEVKPRRRAIFDRYVIKEGFKFDKKTGEFIDKASGEIVPKETAIELVKGL